MPTVGTAATPLRRATARRRALAGTLLVAVGPVLAGCAQLWMGSPEVTVDEVALQGPSVGAGNDALLEGVLTVEDGCVYVADETGTRWLPVFNDDLVGWDGTTLRTAGGTYVDGDPVALGGGVLVEGAPAGWTPPDGVHVPVSCETTDVWDAGR
ncbi:hypothetical protein IF650_01795 [Cellulosimicrobium terreum]|nr:hypothetical protein [Cellulosimicrobium terreum]